jgi:Flp pilus assembly protein CpaB
MEAVQNLLSTRRGAILVGAGAAVLATILLIVYLQRYRESLASSSAPTAVLVARNLIPKGASGDVVAAGGQVQVVDIPRDRLKDGALVDPASIRDRVAVQDIYPGEQITAETFSLAPVETLRNQLAGFQRGVSVQTDAIRGQAGDVVTGDRIDIWVELGGDNAAGGGDVLRRLLANVYVLRSAPTGGRVVLRASERNAARIAYAFDHGTLWFFLRPPTGARVNSPATIGLPSVLSGGR